MQQSDGERLLLESGIVLLLCRKFPEPAFASSAARILPMAKSRVRVMAKIVYLGPARWLAG